MNLSLEEINEKFEELAFNRTTPFCYSCYKICPTGTCSNCGSDDLMRHLDGYGVEFGTDWVIKAIVEEELEEADLSESFEQMIEDCYGETTQICFIEYSTVEALKAVDPVAWNIAQGEHESELLADEQIIELGSKYYWIHDVIELIE